MSEKSRGRGCGIPAPRFCLESSVAFFLPHSPRLLLSATQINEIIAAIVRPRRRDIGRAFVSSRRFLQTITDRINSICVHAEADQKVFRGVGAAIAQPHVVFRSAARVTIAFNTEADCAMWGLE
jgi:hypothetical protein